MVPAGAAVSAHRKPIGRITEFRAKNPMQKTLWGERQSAEGRPIVEGERLFTVAGQSLAAELDDGTRVVLGPSSRLEIVNWSRRDARNRRARTLKLDFGIVWLTVSKVYSQEEPFLVVGSQGVVAVRGTEFVVECAEGGHLVSARRQRKDEIGKERLETEVHVLEGEVQFAASREGLGDPRARVVLRAGEASLLRKPMKTPQMARPFSLEAFQAYFETAVPGRKLALNRETTNDQRARVAGYLAEPPAGGFDGRASRAVASSSRMRVPHAALGGTAAEEAAMASRKSRREQLLTPTREEF